MQANIMLQFIKKLLYKVKKGKFLLDAESAKHYY